MEALIQYSIPIKGLRNGIHQYSFQLDRTFFEHFEQSPIQESDIEVSLTLDKRPDFYVLDFEITGTVKAECDRCLTEIALPIKSDQRLMLKFSYEQLDEEAEVVYIAPETSNFNVANNLYEFACLSLPIVKVYDCRNEEPPVCNEEMLKMLEKGTDQVDTATNPVWDALKDLKTK